jgi:hypothetical protein
MIQERRVRLYSREGIIAITSKEIPIIAAETILIVPKPTSCQNPTIQKELTGLQGLFNQVTPP